PTLTEAGLFLGEVPAFAGAQAQHQPIVQPATLALHKLQGSRVWLTHLQADFLGEQHELRLLPDQPTRDTGDTANGCSSADWWDCEQLSGCLPGPSVAGF